MKTLKLLLAFGCAIIVASCNNTDNTVSGIYVLNFKNEYSIASDTLIITAYNLTTGTYQVESRNGYRRIREGKILPKEFRQDHWTALFDKTKQVLQESTFGRQIYVNTDNHSLSFGGTYQKIK
jgi:hypothetical protein